MFSLTGTTALVTGATGGLGAAIATTLHQQGAHVVLSGTRLPVLEKLAHTLKDRVSVAPCNLADHLAVEALITDLEAGGTPVDIVVNNAGLTRDTLMLRMKNEDWDAVLDVNLKAAFLLCRSAIKFMMKRRFGRIINITSVVGVTGNPGQVNYCASKAGLIGLSKALAKEVASRGITVNCVAPGFMESAMTDVLNEGQKASILANIPVGTMGTPQDIAAACLYLASREGSYVTGQTLHVNGGMAMV